jgi:hypothetical protein
MTKLICHHTVERELGSEKMKIGIKLKIGSYDYATLREVDIDTPEQLEKLKEALLLILQAEKKLN